VKLIKLSLSTTLKWKTSS